LVKELLEQAEELDLQKFDVVISLGGREYFEVAANCLGILGLEVNAPLQGLRIGHRQGVLKKALTENKALELLP